MVVTIGKPKVLFSQERWKDNGGEFLAVSHLKRPQSTFSKAYQTFEQTIV